MTAALLEVAGLSLALPTGNGLRSILADVHFDLHAGEALGLVGESGSGKSLTARSLIRLLPDGAKLSGSIRYRESSVLDMSARALRELRGSQIAMIFQDPRAYMNPVRTIGSYLTEGLIRVQGVERRTAHRRAMELLNTVQVDRPAERLKQYPHELSGGLLQRVMIAGALASEPSILIADEPTTALDVTTQAEVIATLLELREEHGLALLLISHDLELAAATCDRTAVMYAGRIVEAQRSARLHTEPGHPYTAGLLQSRPGLGSDGRRLTQLPGRPPDVIDSPGCSFAPRCTWAIEECLTVRPPDHPLPDGWAACHRVGSIDLHADSPGEATHA